MTTARPADLEDHEAERADRRANDPACAREADRVALAGTVSLAVTR